MSDESRNSQSGRVTDASNSGAQGRRKPVADVETHEPERAGASTASDHTATIEKVPFFSGLDAESLAELGAAARRRTFRAGEIVFHRDDPGQVLYVIRAGKVKIYITSQDEIGRASCRERVEISVVAVSLYRKQCYAR